MNYKKNLIIIMAVVIVAIIGLFTWQGMRNNTGSESITTTTKDIVAVDITAGSIGNMNDDYFCRDNSSECLLRAKKCGRCNWLGSAYGNFI